MYKKQISIIIGIICFILVFLICMQLKIAQSANSTVKQTISTNSLRDEVLKWKQKYDNTYKQLEQSEQELEEKREVTTDGNEQNTQMQEEIKVNNIILGLTDVTGKGVTITLKDNQTVTNESIGVLENISSYLVHDNDLIQVVNELKNAGAEAISINDQRIVNTTAITCDGNVVRINGEKVGAPFIIKAIGLPESLEGALNRPGGYIEILKRDGVLVEVEKANNLTIVKYTGVLSNKYIKTIN